MSPLDRKYQLEQLRRSLVLLTPGVPALDREQAIGLLAELQEVQGRLDRLKARLRQLADEAAP